MAAGKKIARCAESCKPRVKRLGMQKAVVAVD
jgi:hypothetical protein